MPQAASSRVAEASPLRSLPFEVEHTSSRTGAVIMLLLLVPVLGMVVLPVGMVLAFAPHDVWEAVVHKPLAAAVLGAGLIAWAGLLLVAAKRTVQHFGNRRRVTFASDRVTVIDAGWCGCTQWSAPLADFTGIAHHVRTTLSGLRHELVLVHPSHDRSVLVYASHSIAQPAIDRAAHLFRLPQVPAHPFYRAAQRGLESSVIEPLSAAQTA